jgi:hypothetical protein
MMTPYLNSLDNLRLGELLLLGGWTVLLEETDAVSTLCWGCIFLEPGGLYQLL